MVSAEGSKPETIDGGCSDQKNETLFSPRFRSVAAMAGWDEEALLIASLVVEDTPDRQSTKHRKRSPHRHKTPPTNSRRKRRARISPVEILDLDGVESTSEQDSLESKKTNQELNSMTEAQGQRGEEEQESCKGSSVSISTAAAIPCINKLREELSCAICLEICYEPSTTPCGHSFCRKCLRSAAERCGKRCPKCRDLISNGRSCKVNTVLWNTIQLLFPQEVEARKASSALDDGEETSFPPQARSRRHRAVVSLNSPVSGSQRQTNHHHHHRHRGARMGRELPSQNEDAALALRLQREEFMAAFNETRRNGRSSLEAARANLRAMASRAMNIRIRGATNT